MDQWQREREKKIILEKRLLQEERLKSDLNYSVGDTDTVLQYGEAQDLDTNGKCDWVSKKSNYFEKFKICRMFLCSLFT